MACTRSQELCVGSAVVSQPTGSVDTCLYTQLLSSHYYDVYLGVCVDILCSVHSVMLHIPTHLFPFPLSLPLSTGHRCHTFGIGGEVCVELVTGIAAATGGQCVLISPEERLQTKVCETHTHF